MDDLNIKSAVIDALASVTDASSGKSIIDAHLLEAVDVKDGVVDLKLKVPADISKDDRWDLEDNVADATEAIEGVKDVNVHMFTDGENPWAAAEADAAKSKSPAAPASPGASNASSGAPAPKQPGPPTAATALKGVGRVIAVASGKGGVGKSTVAVNLALALQKLGFRVGLLDIDVYGPSIPTLLGINERPNVKEKQIVPLEIHNIRLMSLGFLMEDDSPVIWRGPIVTGIIRQFLQDVDWSGTDYLIIDMPPGTGDAQLSLAQTVPVDGAIVVTTPSDLALVDAARGLRMFETLNVDVLGIVENMSWYVWPGQRELTGLVEELRGKDADLANKFQDVLEEHGRTYIFGRGGGQKEAARLETEFLGHIPLDGAVRASGDAGKPIVIADPDSPATDAFLDLARAVSEVRPLEEGSGKGKGVFSFMKKD